MAVAEKMLSISEVSARTGLSAYTLRFYEREGLFVHPVRRNSAGRRVFTSQEVEWLRVCSKFRDTGMSLPDIRRYVELVREGPGNEEERFALLRNHEQKVRSQVDELQQAHEVIEAKVALYARHLAAGSADGLWRNGPECTFPEDAQDPPASA